MMQLNAYCKKCKDLYNLLPRDKHHKHITVFQSIYKQSVNKLKIPFS